uniref:MIF4G domain-containing protein n=1 Tax=Anopheles culicifacies TaxID=139723 RepID=A0A182MKK2_9DIPT
MEQHNGGSTMGTTNEQLAIFEQIKHEISKINPFGDTIEQTYHMGKFAVLFRRLITNDQLLGDLVEYLNEEALSNATFAIQFGCVFASRQLADTSMCEPKIRNAIIGMLQKNFLAVERLKQESMMRFFNSVTLLGQYYYRKRVASGKRIHILGQSLLLLLTSELEQEINKSYAQPSTYWFNPSIAKLVMAQVTQNGDDAKVELTKELNDLLYTIRKTLIVIPNLCAQVKALLLMTLDVHHRNLGEGNLTTLYGKYLTGHDEQPPNTTNGAVPEENGIETVQAAAEQTPPVTKEERRKEKQTKRGPAPNEPPAQNATGSRSSTANRPSGGGDKASNQNNSTNDKENKRRSTQTKVTPVQKTSPNTTAAGRSIRVQDDGNIVATITRDTPTTTTTTKKQTSPSAATQPTSPQSNVRSATTKPKQPAPRMEKLATLPKITITSATPSPKRTQDKPSPISPRAVLGPSIGKQKPHPPPKSPTHSSAREGQYASKNVPAVPRTRNDRRGRMAGKGTTHGNPEPDSTINNAHKETIPHSDEHINGDGPTTSQNEYPIMEPQDWSIPQESERDSTVVECSSTKPTKEAVANENRQPNGKCGDTGVSTTKPKGKPSYFREENVENLSWDALILQDDESPQKVNPHTKSFLSFLANE